MEPILNFLLANDYKDLEGLQITGIVPITERLANEVLAQYRDELLNGPEKKPAPVKAPAKTDLRALLRQLDVKKLQVRFEAGRMVLEIDVRR